MVRAVVIALMGFVCLWGGLPALTLALTNWSPAEVTCAEYDPQHVAARWLRLSGCAVDTTRAAHTTIGVTVTEAYLPLWPASSSGVGSTPIVLASRGLRYIVSGNEAHDPTPPPSDFEGVTRPVHSLGPDERHTLNALSGVLRPDFVVLDDTATPDLRLGAGLTLAGLLLLALAAQVALQRRRRAA